MQQPSLPLPTRQSLPSAAAPSNSARNLATRRPVVRTPPPSYTRYRNADQSPDYRWPGAPIEVFDDELVAMFRAPRSPIVILDGPSPEHVNHQLPLRSSPGVSVAPGTFPLLPFPLSSPFTRHAWRNRWLRPD